MTINCPHDGTIGDLRIIDALVILERPGLPVEQSRVVALAGELPLIANALQDAGMLIDATSVRQIYHLAAMQFAMRQKPARPATRGMSSPMHESRLMGH